MLFNMPKTKVYKKAEKLKEMGEIIMKNYWDSLDKFRLQTLEDESHRKQALAEKMAELEREEKPSKRISGEERNIKVMEEWVGEEGEYGRGYSTKLRQRKQIDYNEETLLHRESKSGEVRPPKAITLESMRGESEGKHRIGVGGTEESSPSGIKREGAGTAGTAGTVGTGTVGTGTAGTGTGTATVSTPTPTVSTPTAPHSHILLSNIQKLLAADKAAVFTTPMNTGGAEPHIPPLDLDNRGTSAVASASASAYASASASTSTSASASTYTSTYTSNSRNKQAEDTTITVTRIGKTKNAQSKTDSKQTKITSSSKGEKGKGRRKEEGSANWMTPFEELATSEEKDNKCLYTNPVLTHFNHPALVFADCCLLCGAFGNTNDFLRCNLCGESFHPYCINLPLQKVSLKEMASYWKCLNCKFCEVCCSALNEDKLLYCDNCDKAYHTFCLDPPLTLVPNCGWKCKDCFSCELCGTKHFYLQEEGIPHKLKAQEGGPLSLLYDQGGDRKSHKGKDSVRMLELTDYTYSKNFTYCYHCGVKEENKRFCSICTKV